MTTKQRSSYRTLREQISLSGVVDKAMNEQHDGSKAKLLVYNPQNKIKQAQKQAVEHLRTLNETIISAQAQIMLELPLNDLNLSTFKLINKYMLSTKQLIEYIQKQYNNMKGSIQELELHYVNGIQQAESRYTGILNELNEYKFKETMEQSTGVYKDHQLLIKQKSQLQNDCNSLQQQLDVKQQQLQQVQDKYDAAVITVHGLETRVQEQNSQFLKLQQNYKNEQKRSNQLQSEIERLKNQLRISNIVSSTATQSRVPTPDCCRIMGDQMDKNCFSIEQVDQKTSILTFPIVKQEQQKQNIQPDIIDEKPPIKSRPRDRPTEPTMGELPNNCQYDEDKGDSTDQQQGDNNKTDKDEQENNLKNKLENYNHINYQQQDLIQQEIKQTEYQIQREQANSDNKENKNGQQNKQKLSNIDDNNTSTDILTKNQQYNIVSQFYTKDSLNMSMKTDLQLDTKDSEQDAEIINKVVSQVTSKTDSVALNNESASQHGQDTNTIPLEKQEEQKSQQPDQSNTQNDDYSDSNSLQQACKQLEAEQQPEDDIQALSTRSSDIKIDKIDITQTGIQTCQIMNKKQKMQATEEQSEHSNLEMQSEQPISDRKISDDQNANIQVYSSYLSNQDKSITASSQSNNQTISIESEQKQSITEQSSNNNIQNCSDQCFELNPQEFNAKSTGVINYPTDKEIRVQNLDSSDEPQNEQEQQDSIAKSAQEKSSYLSEIANQQDHISGVSNYKNELSQSFSSIPTDDEKTNPNEITLNSETTSSEKSQNKSDGFNKLSNEIQSQQIQNDYVQQEKSNQSNGSDDFD